MVVVNIVMLITMMQLLLIKSFGLKCDCDCPAMVRPMPPQKAQTQMQLQVPLRLLRATKRKMASNIQ